LGGGDADHLGLPIPDREIGVGEELGLGERMGRIDAQVWISPREPDAGNRDDLDPLPDVEALADAGERARG